MSNKRRLSGDNDDRRIKKDSRWIERHGHQIVHAAQEKYEAEGRGYFWCEPYMTDAEAPPGFPRPSEGVLPVLYVTDGTKDLPGACGEGWPELEDDVATYDLAKQCILVLAARDGTFRYRLSLRPDLAAMN